MKLSYSKAAQILENIGAFTNSALVHQYEPVYSNGKLHVTAGGQAMVLKMMHKQSGQHAALKLWFNKKDQNFRDRMTYFEQHKPMSDAVHYGNYIRNIYKDYDGLLSTWLDNYVSINDFIVLNFSNKSLLSDLFTKLESTWKRFKQEKLVHGDIHHENIMVGPGLDIKIIDIDSLWSSALPIISDDIAGYSNFQHPNRSNNKDVYLGLDDVAMAVSLSGTYLSTLASTKEDKYHSGLYFTQDDLCINTDVIAKLDLLKPKIPYIKELKQLLSDPIPSSIQLFVKSKIDILNEKRNKWLKSRIPSATNKYKSSLDRLTKYLDGL